jgi:hypothetical protein
MWIQAGPRLRRGVAAFENQEHRRIASSSQRLGEQIESDLPPRRTFDAGIVEDDGLLTSLPNVTDLDLGPKIQLRFRRQVEHTQDLGRRGRDGAYLVDVTHDRLRDPGNLLGVRLLRLATLGFVLLGPPGGGLLGAFVASSGCPSLSIEARFRVG